MSRSSKSSGDKPKQEFLTTIHEASLMSSRIFNQAVKDVGLTRTQWMVVYRLYLEGECSQTEIARSLSIAKPPLGKVIDLLEKDGWLTRKQNPKDRRQNLIRLTNKVEPLVAPLTRTVAHISRQALNGTTVEEQEIFIRVLEQINENMRESLSQVSPNDSRIE